MQSATKPRPPSPASRAACDPDPDQLPRDQSSAATAGPGPSRSASPAARPRPGNNAPAGCRDTPETQNSRPPTTAERQEDHLAETVAEQGSPASAQPPQRPRRKT